MNTLDQLKEATKRRKIGLFFIKSKHSKPTYRNHPYFVSKQPNLNPIETSYNKQFVNTPTQYGVNNTYKYLYHNNFQKNRRKSGQFENRAKNISIRTKVRVNTQPSNYFKMTQSYLHRSRKLNTFEDEQAWKAEKIIQKQCSLDLIQLTYISNKSNLKEKITIDLFPFVIKCFLRCKIKYEKNFTNKQYSYIKWAMNEVLGKPKKYYDIKNIINFDHTSQLFNELNKFSQLSIQWVEIIRFFFIPNEEVFKYQFLKLLDEMKERTILKYNTEIHNASLHVYRIQDRLKITSLNDLFRPGTYIYGPSPEIIDKYTDIMKKNKNVLSLTNRVSRWKSIAPMEDTSYINQSTQKYQENQKYQRLYTKFKERYVKRKSSRKIFELTLNSSTFVDKSKFNKDDDDIFQ